MVVSLNILEFFHLIHLVDDEDEVDEFYARLFARDCFMTKQYSETEKRWASLGMVSDLMLEVIEPSAEAADANMPLAKFQRRHGQHLHSFAWYVEPEGVAPAFRRLRGAGVRIARPGGGVFGEEEADPGNTIFTHPKDTFGQIELEGKGQHWRRGDPRFQPGWSTQRWRNGPLGLLRLSHMTTVVRDLEAAREFYVGVLGAPAFHEVAGGAGRSVFVLVGTGTVIELAAPGATEGPLAADLAAHGELPHSATFAVRDLEAAERHVEALGVAVADRHGDTLALDPADCYGARWQFIEGALPGDPRGPAT